MDTLSYCYASIAILGTYFTVLILQKRFRLLLPSVVHTGVWLVTVVLISFQLNGFLVLKQNENVFNHVCPFIFYMMLMSIIGFSLAHMLTVQEGTIKKIKLMDIEVIDEILTKFKWVPYLSAMIGIILFVFLITTIGNFDSFSDYRILALYTERTGYAAIAQRVSGHINIWASFYLMVLGYKFGIKGINMSELLKYLFLCSTINMAVGGRVWLLSSSLPIMVTYFWTRHYSHDRKIKHQDNWKLLIVILLLGGLFGGLGILRTDHELGEHAFLGKLLYFTDGSRITNMVLSQYPSGTYNLEFGKCLLSEISSFNSEMMQNFTNSISYDIGLLVTVKSVMSYLYFDFGFLGGGIVWGILCFMIEYMCIVAQYKCKIIYILLFGVLASSLMQSPVFNIVGLNYPTVVWLILILFFRNQIFRFILKRNIKQYI